MQKIGAWIRDPRNNWIKGQTKRAGLYELFCEKPETCDLLAKEETCLHCGALMQCRFGRKVGTEGPTRAARSFSSTLEGWKKRNEGFMGRLKSLAAYNRVFKTHGHFCLPYSFMAKEFMGPSDAPMESKWVAEDEMNTDLLERLCSYYPRSWGGGVISSYQDKEIPKFIADLKAHYPDVFYLLPEAQKARLASISYIGRRADLTTCAPGKYVFAKKTWEWDGEVLRGYDMIFQPVDGELLITIKPKPGEPVTITSNDQVAADTRFLD